MIRIGVIGCGEVARFGHLPAITGNSDFVVVGLYDPDERNLVSTAQNFRLEPFDNLESLYKQGLDAVLIASPAPTHRENVLIAALNGVHVLCEKPIANDSAEGREMADAMDRTGKIFTVGFCYRFSRVTAQIKEWIDAGVIGKVRASRLTYIWNLHGRYEEHEGFWRESNRWKGRMQEGGPMVDCGVHAIDLARYWLDSEAVTVSGHGAWIADYEAPDHVWLHMDHANGAHTMVEMSFTYGHTVKDPIDHFSYHLIGEGGVIRYDRDGYVLEAKTGSGTLRVPGASEKNFEGMYAAFANAIKTGNASQLPTANDGIIATELAWNATKMAIAKRPTTQ